MGSELVDYLLNTQKTEIRMGTRHRINLSVAKIRVRMGETSGIVYQLQKWAFTEASIAEKKLILLFDR